MYSITCSRDSDCFCIYAEDSASLAGLSPILAGGCPNCKTAALSVSTLDDRIGKPPSRFSQHMIEAWVPEVEYDEWPIHGPFSDALATSDNGSRNSALSSNTPHFLVSHASCDVLASLQQQEEYVDGVPIETFRVDAAEALSIVRRTLIDLENETGLRPRPSSGFPRHVNESTKVMLEGTDSSRKERKNKSANRFKNTVIGGFSKKENEPFGALHEQGLITLSRTEEGHELARLSQAGKQLVSIQNEFIHGPPSAVEVPQIRYSSEEIIWIIHHTFKFLRDESAILAQIFIKLSNREYFMDDLILEVRNYDLLRFFLEDSNQRGDPYKSYLRSLIQRWSAVGLFTSRRAENRKTLYSVNVDFEHLNIVREYIFEDLVMREPGLLPSDNIVNSAGRGKMAKFRRAATFRSRLNPNFEGDER